MIVKFKSLLVFSEVHRKYFYTTFSEGINIIKGKNTSGKSTLIQSIIYNLGINDGNEKLKEILSEQLIFRLDLEVHKNDEKTSFTFIRDDQSFYLYEEGKRALRFDGINSDNSNEHIKLKKEISSIFNFSLALESKNELKEAPLEVMLLPYYISQSVGWVYLRESFSGLNFYKNFKFDYLDYFLGLTTDIDRILLHKLLKKKSEIISEIDFFETMKSNNDQLQLSKLLDEEFKGESTKYLKEYSELRGILIREEDHHIQLCNRKSLASTREIVLKRVKRNTASQRPEIDTCPVCVQTLPSSFEAIYNHQQDLNDTVSEIASVKAKITDLQSQINSASNKIEKVNGIIESKYAVIKNYLSENSSLTFDTWLDHKSNMTLLKNIDSAISNKNTELIGVLDDIADIGEDENIEESRNNKEKLFSTYFHDCLTDLGMSSFDESRHRLLYKINSFPCQGVELHKAVMGYHFALNKLISKTQGIHRFPFLLDAVMKEDIDEGNRITIFKFINKHSPKDTQTIFSVSESLSHAKDDETTSNNINLVNDNFFNGSSKIIQIGDGNSERSFLSPYDGNHEELINETIEMTNLA
ncbi:hypothetical protein SAMN05421686_101118 [Thalassolituus maritimus]|uniref:AAA domain-containing protein n=1 Tax=Thalassolituus maritimus TaxID=484498 RepID=A0A1N7IY18_9GAMM|nr:hypothetical protein [Thalassolituus maritimus]SIS41886.1 hypothetical protein SAMN05421686_101118 [Thalassolituus maritimus]